MKKTLALLLTAVMLLGALTACGSKNDNAADDAQNTADADKAAADHVAALIDAKHGYIPDSMSIFIAVIGAIACFFDKTYVDWKSRLIGLAFSVVFFGGVYLIARLILKKEAMGFGDVKLMAACGLALGIKSVFFATLVASVIASVVLGVTAARKKEKGVEYPFAPYLALGCILALFIGEWVVNCYLSFVLGA